MNTRRKTEWFDDDGLWQRLTWDFFRATLVLALRLFLPVASQVSAADPVASTNFPPRLVVAVLPFDNEKGDSALEDWQEALPALVRSCLWEAEFISGPDGQDTKAGLQRVGWAATNSVDETLARKAALVLRANVVVWGSFRRETNGWTATAKFMKVGAGPSPVEVSATASHWVELAESLAVRIAGHLGRRIRDEDRQLWRSLMTESDPATTCLAKALALQIREAPAAEQEAAWRAVLAADARCGAAYASLSQLLAEAERDTDLEKTNQDFLQKRPELCAAHLGRAMVLLRKNNWQFKNSGAEAELFEALRLHPGCPRALAALFRLLAAEDRWAQLARLLKEALAQRPDGEIARILLAEALTRTDNRAEAGKVLELILDLPEEPDMAVDLALLHAAGAVGRDDLAGLEILRLSPQAGTNSFIRQWLEAPVTMTPTGSSSKSPIARPRSFTPAELTSELQRRLTAEERQLVVNPVEITPELKAEARRLTACVTNEYLRACALFAEVMQRGRGWGDYGQRTASESLKDSTNPETRFSCQEYAKLLVAFARSLGLEAWIAHIETCADGLPGYHDCAALFIAGEGALVDPTWGVFDIAHKEFTVLDDVQAISHQAMQGAKPDSRRLRMGLKLNPDDRWTRLQFVRGMAKVGEFDAAAEELRKVRSTGAATWDVHETAAELDIARERWQPALAELQQALILSPSNATVHFRLAGVYSELKDTGKSKSHLEAALSLNRGEFSPEQSKSSQRHVAFLTAFAETQSGRSAARESVQAQAEAGDVAAQLAWAKACFEATPPRLEEAMRWLLKAAEAGEASTQFEYARNLLGLRGEEAAQEATTWLAKSANQGCAAAQYRLGLILYEGKLAARDNVRAGQWVYLAADQGNADARRLLKEMHLFLDADELKQARQRADDFKPVKTKPAASKP